MWGLFVVVANKWVPPSNWQGQAANSGTWLGDIGNSNFTVTDDVARAANVPTGTQIRFVEGVPDFSPFAVRTPAGSPGSFTVEGLVYSHTADARITMRHLAAESGMMGRRPSVRIESRNRVAVL